MSYHGKGYGDVFSWYWFVILGFIAGGLVACAARLIWDYEIYLHSDKNKHDDWKKWICPKKAF